ncbi:hypothetical protein ABK040_001843 [Willaertia magna]
MSFCCFGFLVLFVLFLVLAVRLFELDEWLVRRLKQQQRSSSCYKGVNVVITGASSGIGATLAKQYAQMGANIVIGARTVNKLEEIREECLKRWGASSCHVFHLDVSSEESCKQFIEQTVSVFKEIHILILNAGLGMKKRFDETTDLSKHKILMDVNFWGAVYPTHYALPHMKLSSNPNVISRPKIAVVSSLSGKFGGPLRTAYAGSKHAVNGFFHSLRIELKGKIDVTVLCPPHILTDFQMNSIGAEKGVVRDASRFISPEQFSSIAIEAIEEGVAEELVTVKGKVSRVLLPLLPNFISDKIISSTVEKASSVVH